MRGISEHRTRHIKIAEVIYNDLCEKGTFSVRFFEGFSFSYKCWNFDSAERTKLFSRYEMATITRLSWISLTQHGHYITSQKSAIEFVPYPKDQSTFVVETPRRTIPEFGIEKLFSQRFYLCAGLQIFRAQFFHFLIHLDDFEISFRDA